MAESKGRKIPGAQCLSLGPANHVEQLFHDPIFARGFQHVRRRAVLPDGIAERFAGIALQGATLRPEGGWNKDMYGKEITNREIVTGPTKAPAAAAPLLDALNKYSSRKSA